MTELHNFSIRKLSADGYEGETNGNDHSADIRIAGSLEQLVELQTLILNYIKGGLAPSSVTNISNVVVDPNRVIQTFHTAIDKVKETRRVEIGLVTPEGEAPAYTGYRPVLVTGGLEHQVESNTPEPTPAVIVADAVANEPVEQPEWATEAFEAMTLSEVIRQANKGFKDREAVISWCLDNAERITILSVVPVDKRRARLTRAAEVVL